MLPFLLRNGKKKRILHNFCKRKHGSNKPEFSDNDYIWGGLEIRVASIGMGKIK